jgi:Na+/H+-dicarboxylate symporter
MTVDWIIARARSGVNVMSDMLVAILLDVGHVTDPSSEPAPCTAEGTRSTEPQIS